MAGLAVGSFLNVIIDRVPRGQSLIYPPSHCEVCGHPLSTWDLVPLLSYIWLRGRCRYCRAAIPRRLPLVELATGLLFALLTLQYGLSINLAIALTYTSLFIALFAIDLEKSILPDILVFTGMGLALGFSFLWPGLGIWRSLLGGGVGLGFLLIPFLLNPRGMGFGDVKLAALLGLATGFPLVLVALLLAILAGGAVATTLLITRRKGRKDPMPFGPYLVSGGLVALLWGKDIINWYLRLF